MCGNGMGKKSHPEISEEKYFNISLLGECAAMTLPADKGATYRYIRVEMLRHGCGNAVWNLPHVVSMVADVL
jgi:hypothetical protein